MSKTLNETGISYLWNKIKENFSSISHTHSASNITSGTLSAQRGGTGQTTLLNSMCALINSLNVVALTPQDDDYFIISQTGNSGSTTRKLSFLWDYIKGKADTVYATSGHSHAIKDKFIVSEHTTASLSTNASTTASSATLNIGAPGYYPLGIVGVNLTGTNFMYVNLFNYYLSAQSNGSGTITYRYRNNSTATFRGTIEFKVLWVKTT